MASCAYEDELSRESAARESFEDRRRMTALALHYPLRMLGYLEFTDVYSIDLAGLPPVTQRPAGYEFGEAGAQEIDYICRELVRDEPPVVIRDLWDRGNHCFVARQNEQVVAYNWLALSEVQEEEYSIALEATDAFCLNAYTAPEHRGRGLHYTLLRNMLAFAADHGRSKAYTLVSLFNKSSWKSHVRMGWSREFTYCYFRPYFTLRRVPWSLTNARYPVRLDWSRHSWLSPSPKAHRTSN